MTATKEAIIDLLKQQDIANVNIDALDPDKLLTLQGVDSLDMMNLYFSMEDAFGVTLDEDTLAEGDWTSISAIVKNVNDLIG